VACTVNTAAVPAGTVPFVIISTACATTNPTGEGLLQLSQP
jgi:hypothetical protein